MNQITLPLIAAGATPIEIDLLGEYRTEPLHDTEKVANPRWRDLERQRGSLESNLCYRRARFAEWTLQAVETEQEKKHQRRQRQKAELFEEIE